MTSQLGINFHCQRILPSEPVLMFRLILICAELLLLAITILHLSSVWVTRFSSITVLTSKCLPRLGLSSSTWPRLFLHLDILISPGSFAPPCFVVLCFAVSLPCSLVSSMRHCLVSCAHLPLGCYRAYVPLHFNSALSKYQQLTSNLVDNQPCFKIKC